MKNKLIYLFTAICFLCLIATAGRNRKNCLAEVTGASIPLKSQPKSPSTIEKVNENDLLPPLHFFILSM